MNPYVAIIRLILLCVGGYIIGFYVGAKFAPNMFLSIVAATFGYVVWWKLLDSVINLIQEYIKGR